MTGRQMRHDDVDAETNRIAASVIDGAFRVRRSFGIGLLESVYREALAEDLRQDGFRVATEAPIELTVRGRRVLLAMRADILVEDGVLVEVKAAPAVRPEHIAQLLTYLRISDRRVGLLINFNEPYLKNGIRRRVWSGPARGHDDEEERK